jgi:hypothetical protein
MVQLPSNVVDTLSTATYADLRVTITINGSGPSNSVFLDDLSFGAKPGGPGTDPGEPEREPLPPDQVEASFSIVLPDLKPLRSALIALESVEVDAGVEVVDHDGFTGVTNLGQGLLRVGNGAKVGSVLARGNVQLGPNAHVYGDVLAQGSLDAQTGSAVDGATAVGQTVPAIRVPTRVRFPKLAQPAVQLGVNQTRPTPLSPGRYQSLSLASGSELTLVRGRYLFDAVNLEQGSRLKINDAAGAVEIYVVSTLGIRGRILREGGGQPNLLTVYFGSGAVSATGPLRGTLVAPHGTVSLQSITGPVPILEAVHRGFVLGRVVEVRARLEALLPTVLSLPECFAKPDGTPCADGNSCTVNDACTDGTCLGVPKECGSASECRQRTCDPEVGACLSVAQREGEPCGNPADGICIGGFCTTPGLGYPSEVTSHWKPHDDSELGGVESDELNGVAHSDNYWFWIADLGIQRVVRGESLISPVSGGTGVPSQLSGYDHFGDGDYSDGFLFVPVTGGGTPLVAVFDEELNLRAWAPLPNDEGGWVAVNPVDGRLHSARSFSTLNVYDMDALIAAAHAEAPAQATLTQLAAVPVVLDDIRPLTCQETVTWPCSGRNPTCQTTTMTQDPCKRFWANAWQQGADFSPNGTLYYVLDYAESSGAGNSTGVHMFDVPSFFLPIPVPPLETPPAFRRFVGPDGHLIIKYDAILDVSNLPFVSVFAGDSRARELEGVDVFRDPYSGVTNGLVIELINNLTDDDNATIHAFSTDE